MRASFQPVADQETRVLILGSLPGEVSLQRGEYYANPQNQFWRLIGGVINQDFEKLPYRQRLDALLTAGFGLWDVIESAERVGSLDAQIRGYKANALSAFVGTLPKLSAVAFNGQRASKIGRKELGPVTHYELLTLPSSSPALARRFEHKQDRWLLIKAFLGS
ncbi:MAG: DNA-deoxyinosine glycosylase [Methylobacteriaceae bacterium]|nr:DNA-deoxyinosine glycosylase [Methylobacteriaceae bacterium]